MFSPFVCLQTPQGHSACTSLRASCPSKGISPRAREREARISQVSETNQREDPTDALRAGTKILLLRRAERLQPGSRGRLESWLCHRGNSTRLTQNQRWSGSDLPTCSHRVSCSRGCASAPQVPALHSSHSKGKPRFPLCLEQQGQKDLKRALITLPA